MNLRSEILYDTSTFMSVTSYELYSYKNKISCTFKVFSTIPHSLRLWEKQKMVKWAPSPPQLSSGQYSASVLAFDLKFMHISLIWKFSDGGARFILSFWNGWLNADMQLELFFYGVNGQSPFNFYTTLFRIIMPVSKWNLTDDNIPIGEIIFIQKIWKIL